MSRYFMELSYDGSAFNGWQIQPGVPSVQETMNIALSTLLRENIEVVGAGRTDTGVNASFYVLHFDTVLPLTDPEQLVWKLNRFLCKEIAVDRIYPVKDGMHARFSAISRTYKYVISKRKNPFNVKFSYKVHPLPDIELMNRAAAVLKQYTDFTSFSKLHTDVRNNNCVLMEAFWEETDNEMVFTIKANRFLRNMVRAVVGTLLEVGQRKISIEDFRNIIEKKDRCSAGTSVPGNALFLCDIEYPEN